METTVNLWVAKDQDGSLWLFSEKPTRSEKEDGSWICDGGFMMLPRNLEEGLQFSGLTWESEPVKVRLNVFIDGIRIPDNNELSNLNKYQSIIGSFIDGGPCIDSVYFGGPSIDL